MLLRKKRDACAHVYSDNGSNLVGVANKLKEIYEFLKEEQCIATKLAIGHKVALYIS